MMLEAESPLIRAASSSSASIRSLNRTLFIFFLSYHNP
jgi:hypothetical protein